MPEKNMSDENSPDITIIIDESQDSKPFDPGERFFQEELKKAKDLIVDLIEKSKKNRECNNQEEYFHQHNTIAILGPRGVGKTSFLLSLRNFINQSKEFNADIRGCNKKVIWLPSVDPTRMEKNEIFLVFIVANILRRIRKDNKGNLSQQILDKLDTLSRDFAILAPAQVQEEQWKDLLGDPLTFSYELMNQAHSGLSLAQSFHEFLKECLKEMQADAFVQPIDDVDSTIEQGWPILETIRRYLATPYLIKILSGDIRLYQSVVRKQQVDKLKSLIEVRKSIENEPKIMLQTSELIDQVSQLTDQYLAKIIPPYLRIHLIPLSTKIVDTAEKGEELIKLKYSSLPNEDKEIFLSKIYAKFSYDLFNINESKINESESNSFDVLKRRSWLPVPLLPSATRNMVIFLKIIKPWSLEDGTLEDKEAAVEALAQVFNNSLYNGGIQTDDLLTLKIGRHLEWMAEYCLDAQLKFPDFWTLESHFDEEEVNHRILLLQIFLFWAWKFHRRGDNTLLCPHGPLSFTIKVCFPCFIASTCHLKKDELQKLKVETDLSDIIRHTYLAANCFSYMMNKDRKLYSASTINVPSISDLEKKLDESLKENDKRNYIFFLFSFFMFQPSIGSTPSISIFMGLARLADILAELSKEHIANRGQLKNLLCLLTEPGMFRISSEICRKETMSLQKRKYGIDYVEEDFLLIKIFEWFKRMQNLEDEKLVSPLVIARTFRRFTRNLEFIYRNDRNNCKPYTFEKARKSLELQITVFLNSLLIEEVILKDGILNANLSHNPNLSHLEFLKLDLLTNKNKDFFMDNLSQKLNSHEQDKIPYTIALLRCPLFLIFLGDLFSNSEIRNLIQEYDNLDKYRTILDEIIPKTSKSSQENNTHPDQSIHN